MCASTVNPISCHFTHNSPACVWNPCNFSFVFVSLPSTLLVCMMIRQLIYALLCVSFFHWLQCFLVLLLGWVMLRQEGVPMSHIKLGSLHREGAHEACEAAELSMLLFKFWTLRYRTFFPCLTSQPWDVQSSIRPHDVILLSLVLCCQHLWPIGGRWA